MASLGQIIFYSMIIFIVIVSALIILILALAFSGKLSDVESRNTFPVANFSEDKLLSCYVGRGNEETGLRRLSVIWEKKGLSGTVYRYDNGAEDLGDQNAAYNGRTQLFLDAMLIGNVSLLLRKAKYSDEGEYTCNVKYTGGGGSVTIHLRIAAFSDPTFAFSKGVLTAEASRWFPKPNVSWLDQDSNVLQGTTNFSEVSNGIFKVSSKLSMASINNTYTCRIENDLVTAISDAQITDSDVLKKTFFIFSSSTSLSVSYFLTSALCIYHLI